MKRNRETARAVRLLPLAIALAVATLGGQCGDRALPPVAGLPAYQQGAVIAVPGGVVNAAGANLMVSRTDLELDCQLGSQRIGAVWNSADRRWRWSFDVSFSGGRLTDASGARYDASQLSPGDAIPGSNWAVLSATELRSKGGLVHRFDPVSGVLLEVRWASSPAPRLLFVRDPSRTGAPLVEIVQERVGGLQDRLLEVERDAAGHPIVLRDLAGREARFGYDAEGRLESARDPLDLERGWPGFRYAYEAGQLVSVENSEGERVEFAYWRGRPVAARAVGAEQPTARFSWGAVSDHRFTLTHTDVLGARWLLRLDDRGRLREVVDPLGDRVASEWAGLRPLATTTADGRTTLWSWENDDVVAEVQPSGNTIRTVYARDAVDRGDPFSTPVARVEDDLGVVEVRDYDAAGRLVSLTDGAGETTRFEYLPDEMLRLVVSAGGESVLYDDYTASGHARQANLRGDARTLAFDAVGNRLSGDDPRSELGPGSGGVRSARFDGDRNPAAYELVAQQILLKATDPLWLEMEYRSDGRPLRFRRPYGGDSEWVYDALGRLVARRDRADGAWQTTRFEVDAVGRTTAIERPNGMREEWTFDGAGRTVRHALLRDGVVESEEHRRYERGRLVEIDDSVYDGPERLVYDGAGRVAVVVFPDGEEIWHQYDVRSRLVKEQLVLPGPVLLRTFEHRYDGADRETAFVEDGVPLVQRTFAGGHLTKSKYANGLKYTAEFDEGGDLLATHLLRIGSGESLADTVFERLKGYSCPARFCLRSWGWSSLVPEALIPAEEMFQVGQIDAGAPTTGKRLLISRESDTGSYAGHLFDQLSNRTAWGCQEEPEPMTVTYNAEHNRLLRIDGPAACAANAHGYAYDAAGFVVERDGQPVEWDAAGRVRAIGSDAEFAWDTSGRPLWRRDGARLVRFRFGGVVEADSEGRPTAYQSPEVRIDLASGAHGYRHFDFRGNVHLVTDDAGLVVRHILYGAYGSRFELGDADDPYDFARGLRAGRLLVLGHRVLDPDAAAFLAPDPVYQAINQYAYTLGNPVWFWDPDGRSPSPAAPRAPSAGQIAWGVAYTTAYVAGGVGGAAVGGLVGAAVGPVIAVSVVNHVYQVATGEQGIGYDQFIDIFNFFIYPQSTKVCSYGPADRSIDPDPQTPAAPPAPRREGPDLRRGGKSPDRPFIDYPISIAGMSCGLGFEAGVVVPVLIWMRKRRGRRES